MRQHISIITIVLCFTFIACKGKQAPDYAPTSSIKDIMDSIVEPNADAVWDAVSIIETAKGMETKVPRTDAEWKEVRRHAITLLEAANLLMVPNRRVAKPGEKADNPDVEEPPEAIRAHINKDRRLWMDRVEGLRDAATDMLNAVDAKDVNKMNSEGGELDSACEGCHLIYWYPNDALAKRLYEQSLRPH